MVSKKLRRENAAFTAIERLPQPVIAAIHGVALGGGAEIALACDIRIIEADARIGFPEVNLGVFPGSGGVSCLPRVVGIGRAFEMLYTGEIMDAQEAWRIGLVNRVVPAGECLAAALRLAESIAAKPSLAVSLIRTGVHDSFSQNIDEATVRSLTDSEQVFSGPDILEGIAAFFDKRPPVFTAGRQATRERTD